MFLHLCIQQYKGYKKGSVTGLNLCIRILTMLFFLSGSSDYSPSVLEITAVLALVSSGTGPNLFSVSSPFLMVRMK